MPFLDLAFSSQKTKTMPSQKIQWLSTQICHFQQASNKFCRFLSLTYNVSCFHQSPTPSLPLVRTHTLKCSVGLAASYDQSVKHQQNIGKNNKNITELVSVELSKGHLKHLGYIVHSNSSIYQITLWIHLTATLVGTLARFSWSDGATERIKTCEATIFWAMEELLYAMFLLFWMAWFQGDIFWTR